ncbi:hypothetical protein CLOSCI_02073 [[Clostridium] scindens ATCC 35704]|nr:hypothetical protein CLOSCI_02073 [[Clostridium] scindens ATCC 35704]
MRLLNRSHYFNPLSLYRERRYSQFEGYILSVISIHSPYTGRDRRKNKGTDRREHFNPLSLYRERQPKQSDSKPYKVFQSTLPIQGETCWKSRGGFLGRFQSTLPIQGETVEDQHHAGRGTISIHSPYTGRDATAITVAGGAAIFQSTLPIQGETDSENELLV